MVFCEAKRASNIAIARSERSERRGNIVIARPKAEAIPWYSTGLLRRLSPPRNDNIASLAYGSLAMTYAGDFCVAERYLPNPTKMKLIIGLGNPEKKYLKSRHNLGFMVIDAFERTVLAKQELSSQKQVKKFKSYITETTINNEKIILVKPQTHMNLSGQAVKALVDYYKLSLEDVWVINDDIDLSLGTIRINQGASSAGHQGVQSIIDELGSQDFVRFRIGIRNFPENQKPDTNDFVMANFRPEEKELLDQTIKKAIESISMALRHLFL